MGFTHWLCPLRPCTHTQTFYYHLIRPYEHYVPVWVKGPEDILEAHAWARTNDEKARAMAQAAQDIALKYLSKQSRSCYWLRLLQAYASLQRFEPDRGAHAYAVSVEQYLDEEVSKADKTKYLHKIEY
jgi:hypothetical protein